MLIIAVVLAAWSVSGLVAALILRRHGHNLLAQAGLGVGFGPLVALFHLDSRRNVVNIVSIVAPGGPPDDDGWIDVLVGLDGSPGSVESAHAALALLQGSIHRLRLATVLDIETANRRAAFETDDRLVTMLRDAAVTMGVPDAELVLLTGRADTALAEHAIDEEMDLLVVAHRQKPREALILGSIVSRLARDARVPVLIGPPASVGGGVSSDPAAGERGRDQS